RPDSSSQASTDEEEQSGLAPKRNGKLPLLIAGGTGPGGINEDLEKQLRERALKSMKKLD
ncbi:GL20460, partial [Drosophila persimilis]